jgi:hypothetical protein
VSRYAESEALGAIGGAHPLTPAGRSAKSDVPETQFVINPQIVDSVPGNRDTRR